MASRPVADESQIDDRLLSLRARGFTFAANRDEAGNIVNLVAVRVHHDLIDIVELYGEDDVRAMRIPGTESDIMHPGTVLWRTSGVAHEVLEALLQLADPEADESADPLPGVWFEAEPGRKVWLASSD